MILTPVEIETRRRIKIAIWAFAYEIENRTLVPDYIYDFEARMIDLSINTKRPDLDNWFRNNFDPSTGMWIWSHPELDKIAKLVKEWYGKKQ